MCIAYFKALPVRAAKYEKHQHPKDHDQSSCLEDKYLGLLLSQALTSHATVPEPVTPQEPLIMELEQAVPELKVPSSVHSEKGMDEDTLSPMEEKKVLRRLDIRLVGTSGVLLCISLMDRTNLAQAAVSG